jgi:hypothetical protein
MIPHLPAPAGGSTATTTRSKGPVTRARAASMSALRQSAPSMSSIISPSNSRRWRGVPAQRSFSAATKSPARLCRLSQVAERVTAVSDAASKRFRAPIGRGVVVTINRGRSPSRSACCRMASVSSGRVQKHNSSHQAASNCGPRRLSGSSAEKQNACAPFAHTRRLRLAWYAGRTCGSARRPDSPSIITSRASWKVGAISAMRFARPYRASALTHSAPARVLPAPRPPRNTQARHSPAGASCSARPQNSQSRSNSPSGDPLKHRIRSAS